jgi:hypothetical protein
MTFRLKIDLGNSNMATGEDVAQALRAVQAELVQHDVLTQRQRGTILYCKGSVVGEWKVTRTN